MAALLVRNCAGALTVQDGVFTTPPVTTGPPSSWPIPAIYAVVGVENCDALSLVRSSLSAGAHTQSPGLWVQGNGSRVSLSQIQSQGAVGRSQTGPVTDGSYGDGYPGSPGMAIGVYLQSPSSSFIFASKSVFTGGAGGAASYYDGGFGPTCGVGGNGGHGIWGNNSTGVLRLLETTGVGAASGPAWPHSYPFNGACGQLVGCSGQPIYVTPQSCVWPSNGPPTAHSNLAGTARLLSGATLVRDTTPLSLTFTGVTGEVIELAVSATKPTFVDMPSQFGVLHIAQPQWRRVGGVPASGSLTLAFPLPNLKITNPGATWFMQARFIDATTGQVRLSNLHTVVEVDASY
jgi:hypothetical protein